MVKALQSKYINSNYMNSTDSIEHKLIEVNNILNQLLAFSSPTKFSSNSNFQQRLEQLYDYFIWAQKHSHDLLQQLFQIGILDQIQQQVAREKPLIFLKNSILIMMNCDERGILAQCILNYRLPHSLIEACLSDIKVEDSEEVLEYIGSFLKAYNRLFCGEWMEKFILEDEYFELLEICCKFYNCPQDLTKTTVFNIVLSLISHQQVRTFIQNIQTRKPFYDKFAVDMCKQFRNQLAEYNLRLEHVSKDDNVQLVLRQLDDKVSMWEDISKLGSTMFRRGFNQEVLLPILVGSIKSDKMPLFTLKFALLALNKLIPTINNFQLLQTFIRIIFIREDIQYTTSSLFKASLKPFSLKKLFNQQIKPSLEDDDVEQFGDGIKTLFQAITRTKDNHFLIMVCAFISNLVKQLNKESKLKEKLGFNLKGNGKIIKQLIETLISQLTEIHRINTILGILNTILIISNFEILEADMHNLYIYTFGKILAETKDALKSKQEFWDYLIECFEYDILCVDNYKFQNNNNQQKYENLFKIVFTWDLTKQEDEANDFYSSIPDTQQEYLRYLYTKFIIILKGRSVLLEGRQANFNLFLSYIESTNFYNCPYHEGDIKHLNQMTEFYECQMIENQNKTQAIFLPDPKYLIFGVNDKKDRHIKIIIKIKIKHVHAKLISKKNKNSMELYTMKFNEKTARLEKNHSYVVRGIDSKLELLAKNQNMNRQIELKFITSVLKKTEETLPEISLL